ncbi:MAG: Gx transporter family protein [Clostridiales bacterium]|nr:Gx transporter family protein [Clostridiales bacterium]
MKSRTYKITLSAILTSLSIIAFTIENLFPPVFLAGARIGVSNIFILLSTILLGISYGYSSLILKILVGSLFSGNIMGIMYSLPAGLISLSVEIVVIFFIKKTSVISASIIGAVLNSTVQNLVFCLVTDTTNYLIYLPYLALISVISGLIVGFTVYLLVKYIPNKYFMQKEY